MPFEDELDKLGLSKGSGKTHTAVEVIGVIAVIIILAGGYYLYPSLLDQYLSPPQESTEVKKAVPPPQIAETEKDSLPQSQEPQPEAAEENKITPQEKTVDKEESPLPPTQEAQPEIKTGTPIVKILTAEEGNSTVPSLKDDKVSPPVVSTTAVTPEREAGKFVEKDIIPKAEVGSEVISTEEKKTEVIAPPEKPKKEYTVQVGTYIRKSSLIEGEKVLSSLGFKGLLLRQTVTLPKYSVMVGRFHNAEESTEIVANLAKDNIAAKFSVLGHGLYSIYIADSYDRKEADKLKNDLALRGYSAWLLTSKGKKKAYVLKIKGATGKVEALRRIDALKGKGIEAVLLNK